MLFFNTIGIKDGKADVAVEIDDVIEWNAFLMGQAAAEDVVMTITNVSSDGGILSVEGNITHTDDTVLDPQGELLRYDENLKILNVNGQYNMFGIGGFGLLPRPLNLSLLDIYLTNYTIEGNTIIEVNAPNRWEMTYNDDGILETGIIYSFDVEIDRLSLKGSGTPPTSPGDISFGFGFIIFLSIGIISLILYKNQNIKRDKI